MTVEKSHFQFIFNKLLRIMRARSDEKLIHENGFSLLATFSEASPLRRRAFERFSACLLVFGRFDGKLCWKENKNSLTKFT